MVSGAFQVRLRPPDGRNNVAASWTLPAFALSLPSASVTWGTGDEEFQIRTRVAAALAIVDGDTVEVEFLVTGERFMIKGVHVNDKMTTDVLINSLCSLGIARSVQFGDDGEHITFSSGSVVHSPSQRMWAGLGIVKHQGTASLYFDGATRDNPSGPAALGFCIMKGQRDHNSPPLIQGCVYAGMGKTNNEMEYKGLIEGLIWASRLKLVALHVYGDSELVIRQVQGQYQVRKPGLRELHTQVHNILQGHGIDSMDPECTVTFHHIPRTENQVADTLANQAIETRENRIICNWPDINRLMAV